MFNRIFCGASVNGKISISYPDLPVVPHLDRICACLGPSVSGSPGRSKTVLVTAETGAGKSTVIPLALMERYGGLVIVLEPRRLAAVAVASRMAELLGEKTGETVGYHVKNDVCAGPSTRVLVVTEALLSSRIIGDPGLSGVSAVVLDEFHERSVHGDFAAALLRDVQILRSDLVTVVLSAAMDTEKLSGFFGGAPHIHIEGRVWPVRISYMPPGNGERLEQTVFRAVRSALTAEQGDILVFLPGIASIRKEKELLESSFPCGGAPEIMVLHSSVGLKEQQRILAPRSGEDGKRRIILSSSIAETSLTVPGIRTVIDSGVSRFVRFYPRTGMDRLVTENESAFSAVQRAGRAGRICEGACIRLWHEQDSRPRSVPPEILRSDLSGLVLACEQRSYSRRETLEWIDAPPGPLWDAAVSLLTELDALDEKGSITERGRLMLRMGIHPRCAAVLAGYLSGNGAVRTDGGEKKSASFSDMCALVAVLADQSSSCSTVSEELAVYRERRFEAGRQRRLEIQEQDLRRRLSAFSAETCRPHSFSGLLMHGYPDRIARNEGVEGDAVRYLFPSGRPAGLTPPAGYESAPLFIVAVRLDAGEREGRIFQYEPVPENEVSGFVSGKSVCEARVFWNDGILKKTRVTRFGQIILKETNENLSAEDMASAWVQKVRDEGLSVLPWNSAARSFAARLRLYRTHHGCTAGSLEDDLMRTVDTWLSPFICGASGAGQNGPLPPERLLDALRQFAGMDTVRRMDTEVPETVTLASGVRRRLDYCQASVPVLAVKVQELFGVEQTPCVYGNEDTLHLLSPVARPLQITNALAGFWRSTWPQVVKEMKGRYPKHKWPADPAGGSDK